MYGRCWENALRAIRKKAQNSVCTSNGFKNKNAARGGRVRPVKVVRNAFRSRSPSVRPSRLSITDDWCTYVRYAMSPYVGCFFRNTARGSNTSAFRKIKTNTHTHTPAYLRAERFSWPITGQRVHRQISTSSRSRFFILLSDDIQTNSPPTFPYIWPCSSYLGRPPPLPIENIRSGRRPFTIIYVTA